ncbi:MAG: hypothetical protein KZQ70_14195 [gamma proteobacterium symbiont of Lucinoma myriamae]|nr:hypothetical protein [gamma proteobacterium symbiont of Lucinoma myriamae]MCU7833410.1 hypothetical protein [gamma proteobacterium symbiont of Lucinoma myriamae]
MLRTFLYVSPVLFIATLFFALAGCDEQKQQQAPKEAPPLPVEVVIMENKNIPIWMPYTGRTISVPLLTQPRN